MTREEAIQILQNARITSFRPNGTAKVKEAMSMAIEALSSYDELYEKAKEVSDMANAILADFPSYKEALSEPSIVRCKDCKHWASAEDYDCEIHSGAFGAEDFCSYGERKGGGDK